MGGEQTPVIYSNGQSILTKGQVFLVGPAFSAFLSDSVNSHFGHPSSTADGALILDFIAAMSRRSHHGETAGQCKGCPQVVSAGDSITTGGKVPRRGISTDVCGLKCINVSAEFKKYNFKLERLILCIMNQK